MNCVLEDMKLSCAWNLDSAERELGLIDGDRKNDWTDCAITDLLAAAMYYGRASLAADIIGNDYREKELDKIFVAIFTACNKLQEAK